MRPPATRVVTTRPRDPVRGTTVAHFPLQEVDDAVDAADAITGFPSVQEFSPLQMYIQYCDYRLRSQSGMQKHIDPTSVASRLEVTQRVRAIVRAYQHQALTQEAREAYNEAARTTAGDSDEKAFAYAWYDAPTCGATTSVVQARVGRYLLQSEDFASMSGAHFYSQHGPGVRMLDSWDNARGDGAQTLLVGTTRAVTLVTKSRSCRCAWAL